MNIRVCQMLQLTHFPNAHSPDPLTNGNDFDLDLELDLDLGPPLPDIDSYLVGEDDGDLPDLGLHQPNQEYGEVEEADLLDIFAPDEEDVENQLMHIDDQLIRLDDDIENINEGVQRTLDEAILVHNFAAAPEVIKEGEEDLEIANAFNVEDDSNMELDALLGADEEAFLFSSLQHGPHQDSTSFTESLIAVADAGAAEVNPFDDWQADTNRELEDLLGGPFEPSARPAPRAHVVETILKTEIKEESIEEEDVSDQRMIDSEPEKKPAVVKEEVISDNEDEYNNCQNGKFRKHMQLKC